jgi:hypothetical protein
LGSMGGSFEARQLQAFLDFDPVSPGASGASAMQPLAPPALETFVAPPAPGDGVGPFARQSSNTAGDGASPEDMIQQLVAGGGGEAPPAARMAPALPTYKTKQDVSSAMWEPQASVKVSI